MSDFPIGWDRRPLSTCGSWLSGGTPSRSIGEYWDGEIPWISAKTLTTLFVSESDRCVTALGAENGTRVVPASTILFVVRGMSLKSEFRVGITTRQVAFNQDLKAIIPAGDVDPRFLVYALKARERHILSLVESAAHGTGKLPTDRIGALELAIPRLEVQQRVLDVLSAYDDLIENNKRRMALLEEAIHLLYQDWFVYLRFPGHERVEEVDGVPEGWERTTLAEVCETLEDGDWIETKDQGGDAFRLLQVSNVGVGRFVETGKFRFVSEGTFRRLKCREVLPGDVLVSRMPQPIGRAWLVTEMPFRMITAVDVAILRPSPGVSPLFLTSHLNSPTSLALAKAKASGATRPRIARRVLAQLELLVPPPRLRGSFDEIGGTLHRQVVLLEQANHLLREARDLLLPRLMKGSIPV